MRTLSVLGVAVQLCWTVVVPGALPAISVVEHAGKPVELGNSRRPELVDGRPARAVGVTSSATTGARFRATQIRSFGAYRRDSSCQPVSHGRERKQPVQAWNLACKHANIAVCTTINEVSEAIEIIARQDGWCLVVVGDRKTPEAAYRALAQKHSSVKFLSMAEQMALPFTLARRLPHDHFSRKNVGYLYAIAVGAKLVFDFDDDNLLTALGMPSIREPHKTQLIEKRAAGYVAVNLMPSFGAPAMWPRGFPLSEINGQANLTKSTTMTTYGHHLGVVQSLAHHDPDVDAIYRLGPRTALTLPFYFGGTSNAGVPASTVVLGPQVYAPFNAQATLFSPKAFWFLFLPVTVHGRVSDIWRSYICQRLLWTLDLRLEFRSPFVTQYRNSHDYLRDYMSERPLYETTEEIIRIIDAWHPEPYASTQRNVESIFILLYEHGFIEQEDVFAVQVWLDDICLTGHLTAIYNGTRITS